MKNVLKYFLYVTPAVLLVLASFDLYLIASIVLLVFVLIGCYLEGWKTTLFICAIFALLTLSALISVKLVNGQVVGTLLALVIFLLFVVFIVVVSLYLYWKYPNYQRIRLKWVLEKFKKAGFERAVILVDNADKKYYGEKLVRQDIELVVVYLKNGLNIEDSVVLDSIACFDMNQNPIFNIRASSMVEQYIVDAAIAKIDNVSSKKVKISD